MQSRWGPRLAGGEPPLLKNCSKAASSTAVAGLAWQDLCPSLMRFLPAAITLSPSVSGRAYNVKQTNHYTSKSQIIWSLQIFLVIVGYDRFKSYPKRVYLVFQSFEKQTYHKRIGAFSAEVFFNKTDKEMHFNIAIFTVLEIVCNITQ